MTMSHTQTGRQCTYNRDGIPLTTNFEKRERKEKQKYERMSTELNRIQSLDKVEMIRIIMPTTGIVPQLFNVNSTNLDLKKSCC
jgi:hypothetical protein